jgi:dTDP-4-amino-4,6-dideoxygalactose transaminase
MHWQPPSGSPIGISEFCSAMLHSFSSMHGRDVLIQQIKKLFGCEYAFPVSSGRAALSLILNALPGAREKRSIVIPAYTCVSVAAAAVRAGMKVRICDHSEWSFNYDEPMLDSLVDKDVLAVVLVHPYGLSAEIQHASELARKSNCFFIEDAAQSLGYSSLGRKLGSTGDVAFYSLGKGKSITSIHGGVIVSSHPELIRQLQQAEKTLAEPAFAKSFMTAAYTLAYMAGSEPHLYYFIRKMPFLNIGKTIYDPTFTIERLDLFASWLAGSMLHRIEKIIARRRKIAEIYTNLLNSIDGVIMPKNLKTADAAPIRYPVFITNPKRRRRILESLQSDGVSESYPAPLHKYPEIRPFIEKLADLPRSESIAASIVTLPTHYQINEKTALRIAQAISTS